MAVACIRYDEVVLPTPSNQATAWQAPTASATLEWSAAGYRGANASAVVLCSATEFSLFEVAAMAAPCQEYVGIHHGGVGVAGVSSRVVCRHVTVDLGSPRVVGTVSIRHTAVRDTGEVVATIPEVTTGDPITGPWVPLHDLASFKRPTPGPEVQVAIDVALRRPMAVRALRVRHVLHVGVSDSVRVYEISMWGPGGRFGVPQGNASVAVSAAALPALNPSTMPRVPFSNFLGLNGIWGWGGTGWSNLAGPGWGPHRFEFASHGRNYHNWLWDVQDPDTIPNYAAMSCGGGTDGQWWLSWDWEYAGWVHAGMEVQASIQFRKAQWGPIMFDSPYVTLPPPAQCSARGFVGNDRCVRTAI